MSANDRGVDQGVAVGRSQSISDFELDDFCTIRALSRTTHIKITDWYAQLQR